METITHHLLQIPLRKAAEHSTLLISTMVSRLSSTTLVIIILSGKVAGKMQLLEEALATATTSL